MKTIENLKQHFSHLQSKNGSSALTQVETSAFANFERLGVPTLRHEEWKYTRIASLFNNEYIFAQKEQPVNVSKELLEEVEISGAREINELVFVNGIFNSSLSVVYSDELIIHSLEEAAKNEFAKVVDEHLNHSAKYIQDGVHALNTAFLQNGIFIAVKQNKVVEHPVYIYNILDSSAGNIFSQPRTLIHVGKNAEIKFAESFTTIGANESLTSRVAEIIVEENANVEYYIIQNDNEKAHQVNTTHIRQTGKSVVNTVTLSLNGGIVRNNLNIAMEAPYCESHFYGLYFVSGNTHIDNHTIVDNVAPNCLSNQLYKGIMEDKSNAVFNGKIYVQRDAQKTNAFQSNKNILLSADAVVNTKPQLEIFADDVKCSHGCTIGQLDSESMFYMRSRGIDEASAQALLIQAFAKDILEYIKLQPVREHAEALITKRLGAGIHE